MLNVGNRQNDVTLGRWLLRGPSSREVLLRSTNHARVLRLLGPKQSGTVGTTPTGVLCVESKATSSGTAPKASRVRRGKASMAITTDRLPYSNCSPQPVPLSILGASQPRWPLRLPPLELVDTRPPKKWWLRRPNLLRLNRLRRMTTTTCAFAGRG